jgi:superfamily II DNA/RNA helicase
MSFSYRVGNREQSLSFVSSFRCAAALIFTFECRRAHTCLLQTLLIIQRQRLKAVESLKDPKKGRTIVVATDVAARGLDIPSVATVVHYDAARNVDGFVHRAGRTAVSFELASTVVLK